MRHIPEAIANVCIGNLSLTGPQPLTTDCGTTSKKSSIQACKIRGVAEQQRARGWLQVISLDIALVAIDDRLESRQC